MRNREEKRSPLSLLRGIPGRIKAKKRKLEEQKGGENLKNQLWGGGGGGGGGREVTSQPKKIQMILYFAARNLAKERATTRNKGGT